MNIERGHAFAVLFFAITLSFLDASPDMVWRETRTTHCVFIYQARYKPAVRELCGFAEEVYASVTAYFETFPPQVRCIVIGDVDFANGSYSAPPHHLELYVRSPISPWHGARGESWLKLLFIHEFTHYCDLAADYGFFSVLSAVFGKGMKSSGSAFLPPWVYEGVAVLLETDLSRGGRGRNPFFEMHAKAMLMDDVPFTLGHLEYYSAYPPPSRYYLFGYYFVDFLKRHYGKDVYKKMRHTFLEFPLAGPWHALRVATGKHQDDLWDEFREELKAQFLAQAVSSQGETVSPAGYVDYYYPQQAASFWYAYRERHDYPPAIVSWDPSTASERVLVEARLTDERSYSVSADGRRLVYSEIVSSGYIPGRYRDIADLHLAELTVHEDGPALASLRKITEGKRLWHPVFSPDGTCIAAVQGAGTYSRLVIVDPQTGKIWVLFSEPGTNVYNPTYSPDGNLVAFTVNRRGQQDICILDADAPLEPQKDTWEPLLSVNVDKVQCIPGRDFAGDYYPRFSDNRTVLFTSDREGFLALYTYHLDEKVLTRVFRDRIAAYDGMLTDKGLIYTSYRSHGSCVLLASGDQLEEVNLSLPAVETTLPPRPLPEIASQPYTDLPEFQFWVPNFGVWVAQDTYHIGLGLYALFASTMDSNGFSVSAVYFPSFQQPEFSYNYHTVLGPVNLNLVLNHTFQEAGEGSSLSYKELFYQLLYVEFPLLDTQAASGSNYLSLSTGLQFIFSLEGDEPFRFLHAHKKDTSYLTAVIAEFFYSHGKSAGVAHMFPPWELANAFDVLVPLPLFGQSWAGVMVTDEFFVTLPGLWRLSSLRLGLKACYLPPLMLGASVVEPRGGFPPTSQENPVRGLLQVDYLITIAYLDCPVVGGTHVDALGAGLHWEMPFSIDPAAGSFAVDRYFYAGAEISAVVGLGVYRLPVTIGFNLRLDWQLAEPIELDDLRIYFRFNLNTIWFGTEQGIAPRFQHK